MIVQKKVHTSPVISSESEMGPLTGLEIDQVINVFVSQRFFFENFEFFSDFKMAIVQSILNILRSVFFANISVFIKKGFYI